MSKTTFIIQDWCGNRIEPTKNFETFEDAWDYIIGELTDRLELTEEDYEDYEVEEIESCD